MVGDNGNRVGQVQAADRSWKRNMPSAMRLHQWARKAHTLLPEEEHIPLLDIELRIRGAPPSRKQVQSTGFCPLQEGLKALMHLEVHMLPVIDSCSPHCFLADIKA